MKKVTKVNIKSGVICEICNKVYKTKNSLYNHIKRFHSEKSENSSDKVLINSEKSDKSSDKVLNTSDNTIKIYYCRKCNKDFHNVKTRWSHEQKCLKVNMQEQINELKEQFAMILQEKGKIHHKTFI